MGGHDARRPARGDPSVPLGFWRERLGVRGHGGHLRGRRHRRELLAGSASPVSRMGRIRGAARGPSPGIHGLHDVIHDRGACLRHGDVVPGHRGRGDPSIAGGASLALAGRVARGRVLCVQHPGIRHCRTDRRTRCRWRVGSPRAQAPIRHRARRARGRVRRHLRVHLEPARPGEPGLERAHAGDHPEGPGRCRGALARRSRRHSWSA